MNAFILIFKGLQTFGFHNHFAVAIKCETKEDTKLRYAAGGKHWSGL